MQKKDQFNPTSANQQPSSVSPKANHGHISPSATPTNALSASILEIHYSSPIPHQQIANLNSGLQVGSNSVQSIKNHSDYHSPAQQLNNTYYDMSLVKFPPIDSKRGILISGDDQSLPDERFHTQISATLTHPDLPIVNNTQGSNIKTIQNIVPTTTHHSPSQNLPRIQTPDILTKNYHPIQRQNPRRKSKVSSSYRDQFQQNQISSTISVVGGPTIKPVHFQPRVPISSNFNIFPQNQFQNTIPAAAAAGPNINSFSINAASLNGNGINQNNFQSINNNSISHSSSHHQNNPPYNNSNIGNYTNGVGNISNTIPFNTNHSNNYVNNSVQNYQQQGFSLNNNINHIINANLNRIANNPIIYIEDQNRIMNNNNNNNNNNIQHPRSHSRQKNTHFLQQKSDPLALNGGGSVMEPLPEKNNLKDGVRNHSLQRIVYNGKSLGVYNNSSSKDQLPNNPIIGSNVKKIKQVKRQLNRSSDEVPNHHQQSQYHQPHSNQYQIPSLQNHHPSHMYQHNYNQVINNHNNTVINTSLPLFDQIDGIYMKSVAYIHSNQQNLQKDLIQLYHLDNMRTTKAQGILKSMNIPAATPQYGGPNYTNQKILNNFNDKPNKPVPSTSIFAYPKAKMDVQKGQRENNFMRNNPIASPDLLNQQKRNGSFIQERLISQQQKEQNLPRHHNKSQMHLDQNTYLEKSISQIIDDGSASQEIKDELDSQTATDGWERLGVTPQREIVSNQTSFAHQLERINTLSNKNDQAIVAYVQIRQNLLDLHAKEQLKKILQVQNMSNKNKAQNPNQADQYYMASI